MLVYNVQQSESDTRLHTSFAETWMDLETVIQSEVSQKEKNNITFNLGPQQGSFPSTGWIFLSGFSP